MNNELNNQSNNIEHENVQQPVMNTNTNPQIINQNMNPQMTQPQMMNQNINLQMTQPQMMNQNVNPQMTQSQMMNQNVNPQMTQSQMMNQNIYPPMNNGKKSSNGILIAIIAILGVAAIVCVTLVVMNKFGSKNNESSSSNTSINEYEGNDNKKEDNTSTNETTKVDNNKITYEGFEFTKISGYDYSIDKEEDCLFVKDYKTAITLAVSNETLNDVLNQKSLIEQEVIAEGMKVKEVQSQTYSGIKFVSFAIEANSNYLIYYAAESPADGYIFIGYAVNSNYTLDYTILNTVASIINNSKVSGSIFTNSNVMSFNATNKF